MLDPKRKPAVLSCLADITLALGGDFAKYVPVVMDMLRQVSTAMLVEGAAGDDDHEYRIELRSSFCENITALVQTLTGILKIAFLLQSHAYKLPCPPLLSDITVFKSNLPWIIKNLKAVIAYEDNNTALINLLIGVIGYRLLIPIRKLA